MANLVVSNVCSLKCAYCFARPTLQSRASRNRPAYVSLGFFENYLDYLDRSGINEARLLGGEPSLHPRFPELVRRANQRKKHVVVFTHGLLPQPALDCLESLSPEECTVLVNMNTIASKQILDQELPERLQATFRRLGPRLLLGYTIDKPVFQAAELLALILEYGCRKTIRLGLAQPTLSRQNAYLHPKNYQLAGRSISGLAEAAGNAGIVLDFDCGFVPCMFSEAEIRLLEQSGVRLAWRCSPVIDLGLDGIARHCFPLGDKAWIPLETSDNAALIRKALLDQTAAFRVAGIYKECSCCILKLQGNCPGGCMAATRLRFSHTAFRVRLPAEASSTETILSIDQLAC